MICFLLQTIFRPQMGICGQVFHRKIYISRKMLKNKNFYPWGTIAVCTISTKIIAKICLKILRHPNKEAILF